MSARASGRSSPSRAPVARLVPGPALEETARRPRRTTCGRPRRSRRGRRPAGSRRGRGRCRSPRLGELLGLLHRDDLIVLGVEDEHRHPRVGDVLARQRHGATAPLARPRSRAPRSARSGRRSPRRPPSRSCRMRDVSIAQKRAVEGVRRMRRRQACTDSRWAIARGSAGRRDREDAAVEAPRQRPRGDMAPSTEEPPSEIPSAPTVVEPEPLQVAPAGQDVLALLPAACSWAPGWSGW